jgi:hypothetical protein
VRRCSKPVCSSRLLALLDRAGNGPADRRPFQDLAVGHLVGTDAVGAWRSEPLGIDVAPEQHIWPPISLACQPHTFRQAGHLITAGRSLSFG